METPPGLGEGSGPGQAELKKVRAGLRRQHQSGLSPARWLANRSLNQKGR
jgi:hypothetical protein